MTDHTFIGNIAGAPEMRSTTTDKTVTEFRIAVSDRYRDGNGAWQSTDPVFWPVQIWGEQAKAVAAEVRAGAKVIVVGEIRNHEWVDQASQEKKSRRLIQARYVGLALGDQPRSHTQSRSVTQPADPQWEDQN
ncbi:single-stranded DNA-binding protein (plasmid) [Kribbella sp. WER1]